MIYLFDRQKELQTMIPRRHVSTATQIEVANGVYELSVEVPLFYETDKGKRYDYQVIVGDAWFAGHYDVDNRFQVYKIHARKVNANESGEFLIFDAVHIFFDEAKAKGNIHDRRWRDSEAYQPAQMAFNSIGWRLSDYDVTDRADINFYRASVTDAWNDLIETYNVEFDYDIEFDGRKILNKNIIMKKRIGEWTGKRFAYGTNVMSLEQEQDEAEVYTAAVGRGRGEESGEGHGPRLEFNEIEWSQDGLTKPAGQNWIEIPSATQQFGYWEDGALYPRFAPEVVFENIEDPHLLADSTYQWLLENCVPKAEWKTEVARIGTLNLGDGVGIIYKKAGIIKQARVQKIERNLLDNEQSKLTLGDYRHFKNNKQTQRLSNQINRVGRDSNSRITQLKEEYNQWFDAQETAIQNAYEQALIDAYAEIDAAEHRMSTLINDTRDTMQDEFDDKVEDARDHAEQQAQEQADAVQGNLDSFRDTHQAMYDDVVGDMQSIDDFIGDKTGTLRERFESVQENLNTIGDDLGDARNDLQQQLDTAREELENIEVGGRNLIRDSDFRERSPYYTYQRIDTDFLDGVLKATNDIVPYTSYPRIYYRPIGNLVVGEQYTISFKAKADSEFSASLWVSDVSGANRQMSPVMVSYTEDWQNYEFMITINDSFSDTTAIQWWVNAINPSTIQSLYLKEVKLEKGNKATDWTPAPEDTEQKITTLNEQIEYIEGELSAKLEQTDIEPLQDKITEHSLDLEASAESIRLLQDKTELHDDDITQWSNEITSNAEELNRTIGRVSETEGGLEQAQFDINANADGINALISETDGHESRITDISASVDGIESTVAGHDDWLGTYGSAAEQTIDGFENRVWLSDIHNPNLIPFNDVTKIENHEQWETWYANITGLSWTNWVHIRTTDANGQLGYQSPPLSITGGYQYTVSWRAWSDDDNFDMRFNYMFVMYPTGSNEGIYRPTQIDTGETVGGNTVYEYTLTFTAPRSSDEASILFASRVFQNGVDTSFRMNQPKLEHGDRATPYHNAYSMFNQRADNIALQVDDQESRISNLTVDLDGIAGTVSNIEGDYISESSLDITSDYAQIGSMRIDGDTVGSLLRVSPSGIDAVAEAMRLSGDLYVDGDITALAVDAIEGEFASLFASEFEAVTITGEHIDTNTITVNHLTGADAILDYLMARLVFADEVKSLSLEAVYADISHLRSELLEANVITSNHINVNNALIDKMFASAALVDRLTSRTAFIRDVQAISIDAYQLNLTTLMNSMGEVEGGLSIRRPDGAYLINNGLANFDFAVQMTEFMDLDTSWNGQWYETNASGIQRCMIGSFKVTGQYLRLNLLVRLSGYSPSASEIMYWDVADYGGNKSYRKYESIQVYRGESQSLDIELDLGRPNYTMSAFYLRFWRDSTNNNGTHRDNIVQIRCNRAWMEG